ncbi:SRPBCC family protein [Planosporangium sp. 12N6]|uniref:SRPBCC family protein n=1 Tax=Planosporangium spinosum TaxID=3402278 RepID=UPI003CFA2007
MNTRLWRRLALGAAAGAVGILGVRFVRRAARPDHGDDRRAYLRATTIYRSPAEVYAFWRDLPTIARAVGNVVRVDEVDDRRSRWVVAEPGGTSREFVVELLVDEAQRLLVWRAEDAPVPHEGRVEFREAPGRRGTEVRLFLEYARPVDPAIGPVTARQVDRALTGVLRRAKQIIETGEVITVEGPSGRAAPPEPATAPQQSTAPQQPTARQPATPRSPAAAPVRPSGGPA